MTITFRPGTDPSKAQVDVQNRVSQALSRLPAEVVSLGVTNPQAESGFSRAGYLISDGRYDALYLRNYANIQGQGPDARACPASGEIQQFGSGDYAMRVWLDPTGSPRAASPLADVVARDPGAESAKSRPASSAPSRSRAAPTS